MPEVEKSEQVLGTDRRVAVLAFARMADAVGNSFLIIVLPLYVASGAVSGKVFGLSEALISGLVLALFGLVSSAAQPFTGRFSDRAGKRKAFVLVGLLVLSAANFSFSLAGSYVSLFALRALQGLGAAFTITASVALVNELSAAHSRGGNMGIYNSFRLVGFGAGPLAAGALIEGEPYAFFGGLELSGFEAAFYVAAFCALLSALLVTLLVEDPEDTRPTTRKIALSIRSTEPGYFLDPIFTLGLSTLVMSLCIALLSSIEPIVNSRLGQGPFLFAIQFASFIGALAITQPLVGKASDRSGRKVFIMVGLLGLIPTTLAQGLVATPGQMIAARVLQGISGAMVFAPSLALAGDLAKKGQSGAQLSVLTVAFGFGIAAGQIISGFLVRYGFVVPFASGAVLAAVGAGLVWTQIEEPAPLAR